MALTDHELELCDRDRDIGQETLEAMREIKAGKVGAVRQLEATPLVRTRMRSGSSRERFADIPGVSPRTLAECEHGESRPDRAAATVTRIAEGCPQILRELFGSNAATGLQAARLTTCVLRRTTAPADLCRWRRSGGRSRCGGC